MAFAADVWNQLKNLTADELCSALERDGFALDAHGGSQRIYRKADGTRVSVHYHPKKTYGPALLKGLLADAGWDAAALRRLKLVK